ncbi:MAG: hypothetical protein KF764_09195 [Labilithrix sp.]|nr:hypothetical protein [Labilithrix sp.]MBX3224742.1 hypothetical protein [Labilithrix sp.]
MVSPNTYRAIRVGAAVLLVVAAARHATLAVAEEGSVTRHWIFVPINVGLAALLVLRPRWAFWPAIALSIQQMWSHGLELSRSFLGTAPLDWVSLAVCLFFPTLVTILFIERQEDGEASAEA